MITARSVVLTFSIAAMILGAGMASGQDYPNKPIRIITSPPGGGTDFIARLVAQGLTVGVGQSVVVENRVTLIAIESASKAPPDGYALSVASALLWVTPLLQKTPWDVVRDFSPITLVAITPQVLVVHPSMPVKSVKELIALAKARPGELNYEFSGTGGASHLAGELFKGMAGVSILSIPYKGSGPALTALMSGEVHMGFENTITIMPHIRSGRVKALAVGSAQPSALTPGLPTVAASGLLGFEAGTFYGVFAPAKTPETIIRRLNQEIVRFLSMPEVKQKILASGAEPVGNSPEEFATTIKSDMARLGKVIKDAGIRAE